MKSLNFTYSPNVKDIYENLKINSESNFEEKRYFELLISQAVSTCDYKRLKIYISKFFSDMPNLNFDNIKLIYITISIVTLLTRVSIIEGASLKEAYSLSDAYLSLKFRKITVSPIDLIYEITENFVKLIENAKFYKYDSPVVNQTIEYILNNLNLKFTLKELAAISGVSPEYLSSHFKLITGLTLKNFINTSKINHSKLLLITTDLTLIDIALLLGYNDQSYFSNIFKKITGYTPMQFKNNKIMFLQSSSI